jgi:hypothetical protein
MITRIYEGTNQIQRTVIAQPAAVPGQIGLPYATRDQMGVDVGGGSTHTPYCSISSSAEIDL